MNLEMMWRGIVLPGTQLQDLQVMNKIQITSFLIMTTLSYLSMKADASCYGYKN